MKCPHCVKEINVGRLIGSRSTKAKADAAKKNGKKGGRPRKKPDGVKAKPPANEKLSREGDNQKPKAP